MPASLVAASVGAIEEALLPVRWSVLGIAIVSFGFSQGEFSWPALLLIAGAILFNGAVHLSVRKGFHRQKVQVWMPLGDGLLVVIALLLTGGTPNPYTPLFSLVLASIAMRLPLRQALSLGVFLLFTLGFGLHVLPNRDLASDYIVFAAFSLVIMWSVTALVGNMNQHRISLDNLSRLVSHFPCGVILEDERGLYANPYIHRALDLTPPSDDPYLIKLSQDRDARIDRVWKQMRTSPPLPFPKEGDIPFQEIVVPLDDGTDRVFAFQRIPLRLATGKVAQVATVLDITQERELEQRLQEQERLRLIGTLTTMAIHEVRNPLAAIRATAQLIGRERDPAVGDRHAERIITMVDQLHAFLERLMDLGRIPVAKTETCDAEIVLSEVTALMTPLAHRNGVHLKHSDGGAGGCTVFGDPNALRQVLVNLVQNAVDAMPQGGQVTVRAQADRDWVTFVVNDEGDGIPPEVGKRLFDPFFTTKDKGTGLGLVISNQIVIEHGGKLWFETCDTGTTFYVRLPSQPSSESYSAS